MGHIKIDRGILDWEWYRNTNVKVLFLHMLLKANWRDGRFEGQIIERGSFASSISQLSIETSLSVSQVRTAISNLEMTGEIARTNYRKFTVFTIKNYCLYQSNDKQNDNEIATKSHSNRTQIATIEEKKEYKNIKKDPKGSKESHFVPPTVQDVELYCASKNITVDAERFVSFYASKGWMVGKNKMKDWQAAVRGWYARNKSAEKPKKNSFGDFEQREYDFAALEKELLDND